MHANRDKKAAYEISISDLDLDLDLRSLNLATRASESARESTGTATASRRASMLHKTAAIFALLYLPAACGLQLPKAVANSQRFSRRAAMAAVPIFTLAKPATAMSPTREGMKAFAENDVDGSIRLFDSAISQSPSSKPYLWQRGLSLYYVDRFADGAEQFAADVAVNPNDTEEQIWHLLCLAQIKEGGLDAARPLKLTVGTDRRPVMRAVQKLFLSGDAADEQALAALAKSGDVGSRFYASLYLSLYAESLGDAATAKTRMREAIGTDYAKGVGAGDYMVQLARVAIKRRGWD